MASATTDATVPDAPTGLTATAVTATQIDLFWLAPAYDGGAAVTGYRIEVSENGTAWSDLVINTEGPGPPRSRTPACMPGSTRHYRVSAINRAGTGAPSDERFGGHRRPRRARGPTQHARAAACGGRDDVEHRLGNRPPRRRRGQRDGHGAARGDERTLVDGREPVRAGRGRDSASRRATRPASPPSSAAPPSRCPSAPGSDAQQQSATGTQLASWGAGEYHHLGEPGQSALDWKGNMVSAHAGIDARVGPDILAGVAGSYASGSFDFTDKTGASPVKWHLRHHHGQRASLHGVVLRRGRPPRCGARPGSAGATSRSTTCAKGSAPPPRAC